MLQHQIPGQVNNSYLIFKKEAEIILNDYPGLILDADDTNTAPSISGIIKLEDEDSLTIDSYSIKIVSSENYPNHFPYVFETGGRIPLNIDWHVYPSDGHCCICSVPDEILICRSGINLHSFIEKQVKPYFFNQKHRELFGYFLKERSHGNEGNVQFFIDTLKTKDLTAIVEYLNFIKQQNEPNRVSLCFCGSGIKYRKCHREVYRMLSAFTNDELDFFIEIIGKNNHPDKW